MTRKLLLASVAATCLLASSSGAFADNNRRMSNMDGGMVTPFYGSIDPFYGSIDPFYGSINPFYGSINPFYGQISPFWGDITPFWGNIDPFYGSIDPFYGSIDPFWGNINPFYGNINPFYGTVQPFWQSAGPQWGAINTTWNGLQAANATDYSGLKTQMQGMVSDAASFWGAKYTAKTNKNFMTGFANPMMAKYGIDLNNPASLASVSPMARSAFFLDWYDHLMNYTGTDHVDWWMAAVHWNPQLAQIQGWANNSAVGILDAYTDAIDANVNKLTFVGGYKNDALDHGAAVASLIAAKQDGQGIMGIAPNATIQILYNPFDATGTADWSDVANGMAKLYDKGAHVINASLGVPGYVLTGEWASIMTSSALYGNKRSLVLVKAAGNDGRVQTENVVWNGSTAPDNLIMVGSTDPNNNISKFSNTPGEACILIAGVCKEENKLKYHFMVAPGELLLVQDNHGDVTRVSGTSFSAPLVTGAISLLQDRWPWLQNYASETVDIILQSAHDLGAPGVDPVYGWGLLDVTAANAPLNFGSLNVYKPANYSGNNYSTTLNVLNTWSATSLKNAVLNPGQLNLWQSSGAFIVAFENIGSTYRDFAIPLSSTLIGKKQKINGSENPFESYLYQRLIDWARSSYTTGFVSQTAHLSEGDWSLSMVSTASSDAEIERGEGPFHAEFVAANRATGLEFKVGEGNGAHAFAGGTAFSLRSDFDPASGGVNPVLGFASGGAYARGEIAIATNAKFSIGFSQKTDDHTVIDPTFGPLQSLPLPTSRASASVVGIDYTVADGFTLDATYTRLHEASGLLGAQGAGALSLPAGETESATLGATAALSSGWTVSGSATLARTTANGPSNSNLSLAGGLSATAYELVAAKTGLFGETDQLRVSLTQPLHVEGGALEYRSLQVIDRATGELGPVTQTWDIAGKREYRMEAIYKMMVLDGQGEVDGFALMQLNPPETNGTSAAISAGARFKLDL